MYEWRITLRIACHSAIGILANTDDHNLYFSVSNQLQIAVIRDFHSTDLEHLKYFRLMASNSLLL